MASFVSFTTPSQRSLPMIDPSTRLCERVKRRQTARRRALFYQWAIIDVREELNVRVVRPHRFARGIAELHIIRIDAVQRDEDVHLFAGTTDNLRSNSWKRTTFVVAPLLSPTDLWHLFDNRFRNNSQRYSFVYLGVDRTRRCSLGHTVRAVGKANVRTIDNVEDTSLNIVPDNRIPLSNDRVDHCSRSRKCDFVSHKNNLNKRRSRSICDDEQIHFFTFDLMLNSGCWSHRLRFE